MAVSGIAITYLNTYFDQDTFGQVPLKKEITLRNMNYKADQSYMESLNIKKHTLRTKDFWLSTHFLQEEHIYYTT